MPVTSPVLPFLLFLVPFVVMPISPYLGDTRGLLVTLAGVLVGAIVERVLRPPKMTQERWVGGHEWRWATAASMLVFGLLVSIADSLGRGVPPLGILERLWVPTYRALCFGGGLMWYRIILYQRRKALRRSKGSKAITA